MITKLVSQASNSLKRAQTYTHKSVLYKEPVKANMSERGIRKTCTSI